MLLLPLEVKLQQNAQQDQGKDDKGQENDGGKSQQQDGFFGIMGWMKFRFSDAWLQPKKNRIGTRISSTMRKILRRRAGSGFMGLKLEQLEISVRNSASDLRPLRTPKCVECPSFSRIR